jgi:hypothetical protein
MRRGEKKCRKLKMGAIQFSADISLPLKRIEFWDIDIRQKYGVDSRFHRGR